MSDRDLTPIVVAPTPLPWDADDRLDRDALARNVQRWAATTLSGYVVGSAGGEEQYVSDQELLDAVATVTAARASDQVVIGGLDNPSTTETLRRAEAMATAGADFLRIRIPQTASGGNRGTAVEYFRAVLAASPLPVIVIHQTWQTGGFAATPEEIGEICHADGVYAYICWHTLRYEAYVRSFLPPDLPIWSPNGSLLLPSAAMGATGACCFFADWSPELVREVLTLTMQGRISEARSVQERLLAADFLGMRYGVAALKAGLELLGFEAGPPRSPDRPLDATSHKALRAAFVGAGLLPDTAE